MHRQRLPEPIYQQQEDKRTIIKQQANQRPMYPRSDTQPAEQVIQAEAALKSIESECKEQLRNGRT